MNHARRQATVAVIFVCMAMPITVSAAAAQSAPSPSTTYAAPAQQARMTERQREIMRIAANADGYITEELHKEYWSLVPFVGKELEDFKQQLASLAEEAYITSQAFAYETWQSARLSLRAARVVRSEGLDPAIKASFSVSNIPTYRKKIEQAVDDTDRILKAAAEGTPFDSPDGPMFINEDVIGRTLAGIEGGIDRIKMLLNPKWDPSLRYFKHPEVHVSLLAPWPFMPSKDTVTLTNGMVSDFYILEQAVSESQSQSIAFADYSQGIRLSKVDLSNPASSVLKNVETGLEGAGATPVGKSLAETWREYVSAEGSGRIAVGQEEAFISIRSVYLPEHQGFLSFTAVSLNSLSDAELLLAVLEERTQILR